VGRLNLDPASFMLHCTVKLIDFLDTSGQNYHEMCRFDDEKRYPSCVPVHSTKFTDSHVKVINELGWRETSGLLAFGSGVEFEAGQLSVEMALF
jgi:hypothetical protein